MVSDEVDDRPLGAVLDVGGGVAQKDSSCRGHTGEQRFEQVGVLHRLQCVRRPADRSICSRRSGAAAMSRQRIALSTS